MGSVERVRACVGLVGVVALMSACNELPPPAWLLDELPRMLALRVEVVEEGTLSGLVGPTPADRRRTEALPGDTVAFVPWVASDTRIWPHDELDVAYFVCLTFDCYTALTMEDADLPCRDDLDPAVPICAAGRGPDARYRLPTKPLSAAIGRAQLIAIAGVPGSGETDACIELMRRRPRGDLRDCMLLQRSLGTGPYWVAALALDADDLLPEPADPLAPTLDEVVYALDAYKIPLEVLAQWPNFNPEVDHFNVLTFTDAGLQLREARSGDTITVRVGDQLTIRLLSDPRDEQRYAYVVTDEGVIGRDSEHLRATWYTNREIAPFIVDEVNQGLGVGWRVDDDDGPTRIDVVLRDGADGLAWGSLYFEVDGAQTTE